jgi:RNA polymerase sigma factor (sigma-70 family)
MAWKRDENTELSDLDLVNGCISGDNKSQELLYKRFFSFAMSICIRYAKNNSEAMEIVNDSYIKVLENINKFDASKPFKIWYAKILVNTAIDSYRKNAKHIATLSITSIPDTEEYEPEIDMELTANDILNLFSKLPENYRITFNLYEIEGYNHEEIGAMLGITESSSRSNLTRAKKMLRSLYTKHFNPEKQRHEAV